MALKLLQECNSGLKSVTCTGPVNEKIGQMMSDTHGIAVDAVAHQNNAQPIG